MKKKVLIIVGGISITIVVILLILFFLGIIPNIFLDTSDLYCFRLGEQYETYKINKYFVFSFDKFAKLEKASAQEHLVYYDNEVAQTEFSEFQVIFDDYSNNIVRLEGTTIIINEELNASFDEHKNTRKQTIQKYEGLGYACE